MEIFMRLKKVFWVQAYRVLGNTLMTNWLPYSSHRAYGNSFSFLLIFGAEDIFRGSRARLMEEAMNLPLCIPGCTIYYAQFSSQLLWYVVHKE